MATRSKSPSSRRAPYFGARKGVNPADRRQWNKDTRLFWCSDAENFLWTLGRWFSPWEGMPKGTWIFRGHPNAKWPLLPKAYRPDQWLRDAMGQWVRGAARSRTVREQMVLERNALLDFYWRADKEGLQLPEDSQALRRALDPYEVTTTIREWPDASVLSLLALAQHHGVPTRLLDWTSSFEVAAYFAAVDLLLGRVRAKALGVWAFDHSCTRPRTAEEQQVVYGGARPGALRMTVVTGPSFGNPNLKAQEGLFVLDEPDLRSPDDPVDVRPVEQFAGEHLKLLVLDGRHAPELMMRLRHRGVDAATLFPGFDGIVRAQNELRLIQAARSKAPAR